MAAARILALLSLLASPAFAADAPPSPPKPIAGVFHAKPVDGSPTLAASGLCWWHDKLVIADRVNKRFLAYTPGKGFDTLKDVRHPVGCAVDPQGRLVVTEKEPNGLRRVGRLTADGKDETLAEGDAVGTPHFVTVHSSGTIFWSGFPDGGTRSLAPQSKDVVTLKPRIVHTYGIGLSPDEKWLYVASKIPNPDRRGVWRFPLDPQGRAAGDGEFFLAVQQLKPTLPDLPAPRDGDPTLLGWVGRLQGLAVDELGYLYVAGAESHNSGEAVAVVTPDGKSVAAMILGVPRNVSGLAFGGPDGRTLYVTGAGNYKLHEVHLPVPGARLTPKRSPKE